MTHNVGGIDRAFRIGIGFPALSVAVATDDWLLRIVFGVVAAGGIITWALGYCPINDALGRNTVKKVD
jgi:Inner membrane protein YgaP-like, transmembrane domain